jgi:hypothetical protein
MLRHAYAPRENALAAAAKALAASLGDGSGASGGGGAGEHGPRSQDERHRVLSALRAELAHAPNEDAILCYGAAALAALFPDDATPEHEAGGADGDASLAPLVPCFSVFALGTFAEGAAGDALAALRVACAHVEHRAALTAALQSVCGGAAAAAAPAPDTAAAAVRPLTSIALACGARPGAVDSRDAAAAPPFADWEAASIAGLPRSRVAVTAPLTAGPVVVGFVQVHRIGAATAADASAVSRAADAATVREFADAVGGAIFVRRAFALNRCGSSSALPLTPPAFPVRERSPTHSARRASLEQRRRVSFEDDDPFGGGGGGARGLSARVHPAASVAEEAPAEEEDEEDRARLLDWALDPWALSDDDVRRLCVTLLRSLGLLARFGIAAAAAEAFVAAVAARYNDSAFLLGGAQPAFCVAACSVWADISRVPSLSRFLFCASPLPQLQARRISCAVRLALHRAGRAAVARARGGRLRRAAAADAPRRAGAAACCAGARHGTPGHHQRVPGEHQLRAGAPLQ